MYPLKFKSLYYEKPWGKEEFKIPRDDVPKGKIGESWDIACHPKGMSIVSNGKYKGIGLDDLIEKKGKDLVGSKISLKNFPLLVKVLNTSEKLSVQVHPDDEYGLEFEGEMGKTEVWYILDAEEGASIIVGTNNCTKEEFKEAIEGNHVEDCMNKIYVEKGDVYFLKSGLVHSIGSGILAIEIQQNSDTTYRVFDYNRGRELHISKALEVIDFELEGKKSKGITIKKDSYAKTYYCLNEHFSLELYDIDSHVVENSDIERFFIFTCIDGHGVVHYKDGQVNIGIGDSILIPAKLGEFKIEGNLKILKSYVPDVFKVKEEILKNIQ